MNGETVLVQQITKEDRRKLEKQVEQKRKLEKKQAEERKKQEALERKKGKQPTEKGVQVVDVLVDSPGSERAGADIGDEHMATPPQEGGSRTNSGGTDTTELDSDVEPRVAKPRRVTMLEGQTRERRLSNYAQPPMPEETRRDILKSSIKLKHKKNKVGETVYKGHPSWLLMRDIQTGLFNNIKNLTKHKMECSDLYYTPKVTVHPITEGSEATFKFKDYCPMAFYKLREHYNVSHFDYVTSLCQNWSEVGSPGKSGSLFFFSNDNQYVLKTIPKREAKLLRALLPAYYEYMTTHENSLLTKFMGLHRVKPHKGRQVRFLVMVNLFRTNMKVHQRFDLKGSTQGRELTPAERLKKSPTFKDLDFRKLDRKIHLGPGLKVTFLQQVEQDCKFLASQNIMDYSLLLGIHYLEEDDDSDKEGGSDVRSPPLNMSMGMLPPLVPDEGGAPNLKMASVFEREESGIRARDENDELMNEHYFLGVIDILMLYSMRKKLEHVVKASLNPKSEVSSVEPEEFADRFIHFMSDIVT